MIKCSSSLLRVRLISSVATSSLEAQLMNHGNNTAGTDWLSLARQRNLSQSSCKIHSASLLCCHSAAILPSHMTNSIFFNANQPEYEEQHFKMLRSSQAQRRGRPLCTGKECKPTLVNSPSPLQSAEIIGLQLTE